MKGSGRMKEEEEKEEEEVVVEEEERERRGGAGSLWAERARVSPSLVLVPQSRHEDLRW